MFAACLNRPAFLSAIPRSYGSCPSCTPVNAAASRDDTDSPVSRHCLHSPTTGLGWDDFLSMAPRLFRSRFSFLWTTKTNSHHYANLGLRKLSFKPMIFQYLHAFSIDMRDGKRRLFQSIRSNLFLLPGYARGDGLARTTWKREFTIQKL